MYSPSLATRPSAMVPPAARHIRYSFCVVALLALVACSSDDPAQPESAGTAEPVASQQPTQEPAPAPEATGALTIAATEPVLNVIEGKPAVEVELRVAGSSASLQLESETDSDALLVSVTPAQVSATDAVSVLRVEQPIGMAPILPALASVTITATGDTGESGSLTLSARVTPTDRPDLYLMAGQSNMVGFSGINSRAAAPGQPDAPMLNVLQLNVTGNDEQNFASPRAFTDAERIAVKSPRYVSAIDPLHDGYESTTNSKSGTQIGPGLSFARSATAATTADIYLVPAAWSDTGFCARATNRFAGMGWNATTPSSDAFSGTLLHDRAIARINLALAETGGILRGILWHQGEADSDEPECAAAYADNLTALAQSLRTAIDPDARGAEARGPDAALPFIVGTMSRGADSRGDFSVFPAAKQLVDDAHRSISTRLAFAEFVNNDDLVPPEYPCGEAACIHFGATAHREMGDRYFRALQRVVVP